MVEQARRLARAAVHKAHSSSSGQSVFFFPTHPHLDIFWGGRELAFMCACFSLFSVLFSLILFEILSGVCQRTGYRAACLHPTWLGFPLSVFYGKILASYETQLDRSCFWCISFLKHVFWENKAEPGASVSSRCRDSSIKGRVYVFYWPVSAWIFQKFS